MTMLTIMVIVITSIIMAIISNEHHRVAGNVSMQCCWRGSGGEARRDWRKLLCYRTGFLVILIIIIITITVVVIQGDFFHCHPPKKLKQGDGPHSHWRCLRERLFWIMIWIMIIIITFINRAREQSRLGNLQARLWSIFPLVMVAVLESWLLSMVR